MLHIAVSDLKEPRHTLFIRAVERRQYDGDINIIDPVMLKWDRTHLSQEHGEVRQLLVGLVWL